MMLQSPLLTFDASQAVWFWVVLLAYLAVLIAFGWYSKKKTKSVSDYLVAGRSIGPVLLGLSFGVTYFSSVLLIGGAGFSYIWGLGTVWIAAIDVLVGVFIIFVFFGHRTQIISNKGNIMTVPQLLGYRYQNPQLRMLVGGIVMVFETIYVVSIYTGLSILLTLLTPPEFGKLGYYIGVGLCAAITMAYLVAGGSIGAILSDAVESLVMAFGVIVIFIIGIVNLGGFEGFALGLQIQEASRPFYTMPDSMTTFVGFGTMGIIGYVFVTAFGQWGMPQAISRFFTAKKKRAIKWGLVVACIWASIVSIFAWVNGVIASSYWYYTGDSSIIAYLNAGGFANRDYNLPLFLQKSFPVVIAAIFLAAVTAASMTTEEKVILVAASGFAQDIYENRQNLKGKTIPDERMLKITRLTTAVLLIVSLILTLLVDILGLGFVLELCMFAWSGMASAILIPYVFGLFWKRGTAKGAMISGIAGIAAAVTWWALMKYSLLATIPEVVALRNFVLTTTPFTVTLSGIHEFLVSQAVALIAFPVASLLTAPPKKEFVDEIFAAFKAQKMMRRA
jgi:SSS family solute:Na+ symporter